jgi:hypothetical protein
MQQCPEVFIAFQDNMATTAAITAIGPAHGREFIAHKVLAAGTTVAAAAKDPDLVNKVAFLQNVLGLICKYILRRAIIC